MAFSKLCLFLSLLAFAFLLSSYQAHCNDKEDSLRRGINTYRKSLNLSSLPNNGKASCLADEIANALENHPCTGAGEFAGQKDPTGVVATFVNFPKLLKDCQIDANTTFSGAVLPACVPRMTGDLLIGNYTRSRYAKFLKDSRFTGAGVGSEDDWFVVILTTDKPSGSFSGASSAAVKGLAAGLALGLVACVSHLLF